MGTIEKVGWELDWGRSAKVKRINVSQESWDVLKPCGKNSILRTLAWFWRTGSIGRKEKQTRTPLRILIVTHV